MHTQTQQGVRKKKSRVFLCLSKSLRFIPRCNKKFAAEWCSVLQLQCVVVCCSVLQCIAVCCSVLQCVAVCCSVLQYVAVCCSVVQCVAVCCSMLQCVAMSCKVSQCVAVRCSALQYVAMCYSMLLCTKSLIYYPQSNKTFALSRAHTWCLLFIAHTRSLSLCLGSNLPLQARVPCQKRTESPSLLEEAGW